MVHILILLENQILIVHLEVGHGMEMLMLYALLGEDKLPPHIEDMHQDLELDVQVNNLTSSPNS